MESLLLTGSVGRLLIIFQALVVIRVGHMACRLDVVLSLLPSDNLACVELDCNIAEELIKSLRTMTEGFAKVGKAIVVMQGLKNKSRIIIPRLFIFDVVLRAWMWHVETLRHQKWAPDERSDGLPETYQDFAQYGRYEALHIWPGPRPQELVMHLVVVLSVVK